MKSDLDGDFEVWIFFLSSSTSSLSRYWQVSGREKNRFKMKDFY
jgi:hypothetical protein